MISYDFLKYIDFCKKRKRVIGLWVINTNFYLYMGWFDSLNTDIAKGVQERYGLKIDPASRWDEQERMEQAQSAFRNLERKNWKAEAAERQELADPGSTIDTWILPSKSPNTSTLGLEKLIAAWELFSKKQEEALPDRWITPEVQKTLENYGYTIDETTIATSRYSSEIDTIPILITGNRMYQEIHKNNPILWLTVERDMLILKFKEWDDIRLPTIDPLIWFQKESDVLITEQASWWIQFYDSIQNRIRCYRVILSILDASVPVNSGSTYVSQEMALADGMRRVGIRRMIDDPTVNKLLSGQNSLSRYFESRKQ